MKIYHGVEQQIQDAIAWGEFDNLSTQGKPLDLRETPAHLRMSYSILKNAQIIPPEVQVKLDVSAAELKLKDPKLAPDERAELTRQLSNLVATDGVRQERVQRQSARQEESLSAPPRGWHFRTTGRNRSPETAPPLQCVPCAHA